MKRIKVLILLAVFMNLYTATLANTEEKGVEAEKAIQILKDGNNRFVNEKYANQHISKAYRKELAKGQHPFAVIVTCSDSRLTPEILFDQGLGDVFVIRTAGEVVDKLELGSIEYAVEHLGANLIVVLGHDNCGAVKAAVEGGEIPENISFITDLIKPAVERAKKEKGNLLANAIENNVEDVMDKINQDSDIIFSHNDVQVVGAIYDFTTNKIKFLE